MKIDTLDGIVDVCSGPFDGVIIMAKDARRTHTCCHLMFLDHTMRAADLIRSDLDFRMEKEVYTGVTRDGRDIVRCYEDLQSSRYCAPTHVMDYLRFPYVTTPGRPAGAPDVVRRGPL